MLQLLLAMYFDTGSVRCFEHASPAADHLHSTSHRYRRTVRSVRWIRHSNGLATILCQDNSIFNNC